MSRALDFVALVTIIFLFLIIQFAGATTYGPIHDTLADDDTLDDTDVSNLENIKNSVTFWVPLIGQLGAIAIVAWREYRRRRDTAVRQVPL